MKYKELSKMTKKEKKEYYKQFRNTWKFDPTTRKTQNQKAYNRKKNRSLKDDFQERYFCLFSKDKTPGSTGGIKKL